MKQTVDRQLDIHVDRLDTVRFIISYRYTVLTKNRQGILKGALDGYRIVMCKDTACSIVPCRFPRDSQMLQKYLDCQP